MGRSKKQRQQRVQEQQARQEAKQEKAQETINEDLRQKINNETGGLDLKNSVGASDDSVQKLMKEMEFTDDQVKAFNEMNSHFQGVRSLGNSDEIKYEQVKRKIAGYGTTGYSEESHAELNALTKEREALEEKLKNIQNPAERTANIHRDIKQAGQSYSDSRGKFLNSMGGDAEKLSKFNEGLKNLAREEESSIKNSAKNFLKDAHLGKIGVTALVGIGLVQAMSDSRGQQDNSQLYGAGGGF